MLDLLRRDFIGEILEAQLERFFDNYAATDTDPKKLVTSSSFMIPITTFVQRKSDCPITDQKHVIAKGSKRKPLPAKGEDTATIEAWPSRSDSRGQETHRSSSSRRQSRTPHAKCEDWHV